tara:strand:+ start:6036 stop:7832 length:1797 start_codon:yes stop_codon:yes gene_type:complete
MPVYVDNAQNRKLNRVGLEKGKNKPGPKPGNKAKPNKPGAKKPGPKPKPKPAGGVSDLVELYEGKKSAPEPKPKPKPAGEVSDLVELYEGYIAGEPEPEIEPEPQLTMLQKKALEKQNFPSNIVKSGGILQSAAEQQVKFGGILEQKAKDMALLKSFQSPIVAGGDLTSVKEVSEQMAELMLTDAEEIQFKKDNPEQFDSKGNYNPFGMNDNSSSEDESDEEELIEGLAELKIKEGLPNWTPSEGGGMYDSSEEEEGQAYLYHDTTVSSDSDSESDSESDFSDMSDSEGNMYAYNKDKKSFEEEPYYNKLTKTFFGTDPDTGKIIYTPPEAAAGGTIEPPMNKAVFITDSITGEIYENKMDDDNRPPEGTPVGDIINSEYPGAMGGRNDVNSHQDAYLYEKMNKAESFTNPIENSKFWDELEFFERKLKKYNPQDQNYVYYLRKVRKWLENYEDLFKSVTTSFGRIRRGGMEQDFTVDIKGYLNRLEKEQAIVDPTMGATTKNARKRRILGKDPKKYYNTRMWRAKEKYLKIQSGRNQYAPARGLTGKQITHRSPINFIYYGPLFYGGIHPTFEDTKTSTITGEEQKVNYGPYRGFEV